jgi:hypothetical protein
MVHESLTVVDALASLGPNTVVDETEEVPFRGSLSLEIPEDPSARLVLRDVDLGADIICCSLAQVGAPLVNEIDVGAGADICRRLVGAIVAASRKGTVVASSNAVAVLFSQISTKSTSQEIQLTKAGAQSVKAADHSPLTTRLSDDPQVPTRSYT